MDRIATVEPLKKGGEGVRTMGSKEECVIDKSQSKAGLQRLELKKSCSR